jgi:hypothetical protein
MKRSLENFQNSKNYKDSYLIKDDKRMIIDLSKDNRFWYNIGSYIEQ